MNVTEKHVKSKRVIGTLSSQPVQMVETTGGLYIIAMNKNGHTEILGSGPHIAVAKFLASKKEPDLVLMSDEEERKRDKNLSKSEQVNFQKSVESMAPKYLALTERMNALVK